MASTQHSRSHFSPANPESCPECSEKYFCRRTPDFRCPYCGKTIEREEVLMQELGP